MAWAWKGHEQEALVMHGVVCRCGEIQRNGARCFGITHSPMSVMKRRHTLGHGMTRCFVQALGSQPLTRTLTIWSCPTNCILHPVLRMILPLILEASLYPPRCDHVALTIHVQSHPLVLVACPMGGHIGVRQEGWECVKTPLLQRSVQPSAQG